MLLEYPGALECAGATNIMRKGKSNLEACENVSVDRLAQTILSLLA